MTHSNTNPAPSARKLAYQALYDVLEKDAYANITLQSIMGKYTLKKEEAHLLTELVYGVLRKYNYLLWIISQMSKQPLKKLHPSVRILLCISLYQLLYLTRIPESAAVNESVKIAKKLTHQGNVRFINGLLRNYLRQKDHIVIPTEEENPLLHDELTYCLPGWLIQRWENQWGREKAQAVFAALNETPRMTLRVNRLKTTKEDFLKRLAEKDIEAEDIPVLTEGLTIRKGANQFFTSLLSRGEAYVQSASSMVPVHVLAPKAGETVLDMCAAPGSKTTQMAEWMDNEGTIDAWDLYPHKISLIKRNAKKEGITIIHAGARDSSKPMSQVNGKYDKILLDAPCSGLGVLGHKAEIRWRRQEADLAAFPPLQKKLLACAAAYLKSGGTLVYSTCTLNHEENEDMIRWFLSEHPEFVPVDFTLANIKSSENGMMTLWPDEWNSDGFFVAKLRKVDGKQLTVNR